MDVFDTVIGQNVKLQGSLANQGAIQINGVVDGQVESDSTVIVGVGALVKGPVKAKVVEISGEVSGSVNASERIEIFPKGRLVGDATTKNFVIRLGAAFVGKSQQINESTTKGGESANESIG